MKLVLGSLAFLVLLVAAALAVVHSGVYNVAATYPHSDFTRWLLHTTMKNSVRQHAREVPVPPPNLAAYAKNGGRLYGAMCEQCHGGPGVEADELSKGMRPSPPDLAKTAPDWSAQEIFWIIKHGIRLTGMPAWREVHDDEEIWALTAFVKMLPSLSAEEYRSRVPGEERPAHGH